MGAGVCLPFFNTIFAHRSGVANLSSILVHRIQGYAAKSEACACLPQGNFQKRNVDPSMRSSSLPSLTAPFFLLTEKNEVSNGNASPKSRGLVDSHHLTIPCHSVAS